MHVKTQGLVLREVNYKESDKILTVLTAEGGKRTVKARGCRRRDSRVAASAQLLVYSEMTLFEYRDFWSMDEASSLEQFWGVRADVEKLALASYFARGMKAVRAAKRGGFYKRGRIVWLPQAAGAEDRQLDVMEQYGIQSINELLEV